MEQQLACLNRAGRAAQAQAELERREREREGAQAAKHEWLRV
jgi:hypothetical protein